MTRSLVQLLLWSILALSGAKANALTIVENYCNDQAEVGLWQEGVGAKRVVGNIIAEFDPEYSALISYLDRLPVQSNESTVLAGMKANPQSTTKIGNALVRFQWDIEGKKSHLHIILMIYKGCISQISLMDSSKKILFSRQTTLSTQP